MKTNSLVISGGGSKGAFGAGKVYAEKKDYANYYGSSTGSLICLLSASGKYEKLKHFYTNVDNEDIYDNNPFNKKGELNKWKSIYRFLTKKQGISSTNKLLGLIREVYTEKDHKKVKDLGKDIIVAVTNVNTKDVEYKRSSEHNWFKFTQWVWVSTLAYPFAETVIIDGVEYGDGGYSVNLPVELAIEECLYQDVIVHAPKNYTSDFENKNVLQGIIESIELLLATSMNKDIRTGKKQGKKVSWTFTPYNLTNLSMRFDKKEMKEWFNLGFNS